MSNKWISEADRIADIWGFDEPDNPLFKSNKEPEKKVDQLISKTKEKVKERKEVKSKEGKPVQKTQEPTKAKPRSRPKSSK